MSEKKKKVPHDPKWHICLTSDGMRIPCMCRKTEDHTERDYKP